MTPKEKTIEWVKKQRDKEKDKWSAGSKNLYLQWDDWYKDLLNMKTDKPTYLPEYPCNNCMLNPCSKTQKMECEKFQNYLKEMKENGN